MKEIFSRNISDNELLDNNIDYIVNIINDKSIRNKIQIEILAKNLKKNHKDVKLKIESELITTIIEENLKSNRTKRTTIRTKLMPKITNIQNDSVAVKKKDKNKKAFQKNTVDSNDSSTGLSDSGISEYSTKVETSKIDDIELVFYIEKYYNVKIGVI